MALCLIYLSVGKGIVLMIVKSFLFFHKIELRSVLLARKTPLPKSCLVLRPCVSFTQTLMPEICRVGSNVSILSGCNRSLTDS